MEQSLPILGDSQKALDTVLDLGVGAGALQRALSPSALCNHPFSRMCRPHIDKVRGLPVCAQGVRRAGGSKREGNRTRAAPHTFLHLMTPTVRKEQSMTTKALLEKNQGSPVRNILKNLMMISIIVCLQPENLLREQGELISPVLLALRTRSALQVQSPALSLQVAAGNSKVPESV